MPVKFLMSIQQNSSYPLGSLVSDRSVFTVPGRCESKRRWIELGNTPDDWQAKFVFLTVTDLDHGSEEYQSLKPNFETGRPVRHINLISADLDLMYPNWREYYEISESWSVIEQYIEDVI